MPVILIVLALLSAACGGAHASTPDDLALRHFAARGETRRVEAEIARLKALDPRWRPPADLALGAGAPADDDDLWDILDIEGVQAALKAVETRKSRDPAWAPSLLFTRALKRRVATTLIAEAAQAGRWSDVVAAAGGDAVDPRDLATLWLVGEALVRTDRRAEAAALFRTVATDPRTTDEELRGSIQKAIALVGMGAVEPILLSLSERAAALEALAPDIARARIAASLKGEEARPPDPAALNALADIAKRASDPADAGLLAWYAYERREDATALAWFRLALSKGGDAMIAHGLAHTLRRLGQLREAEEVAFLWRDRLPHNAILFIDILEVDLTRAQPPIIEPERLARYARVVTEHASGEGAQALGWYAMNTCEHEAARAWFARAVAWMPKEATVMGYALALRRLGLRREFLEVVNRADGLFPSVVALVWGSGEPGPPSPCDNQPASQRRAPRRASPAEFPLAVAMENPLRFGARPIEGATAAGRPPRITTARRVRGVGPMPYEHWGYALLPAYDGATAPADVHHDPNRTPAGVAWAREVRDQPGPTLAGAADLRRFRHLGSIEGERR